MGFVEELKWWHWIIISLVLGAALGYVNSNAGTPAPVHSSMTQIVFEEKLLSTARDASGNKIPWISSVVIHPVTDLASGPVATTGQLVTFSCYNEPSGANKSGSTDSYSIMVPCPYEPRARINALGPTSYPGMTKFMARGGDTLDSVMKRFYGKASPQGEHAIIGANEVFRHASKLSEVVFLPFRVYWIPWNPAENHTFSDFLSEVNKNLAANSKMYAGTIGSRYAWWETPNHVYTIAMGGSFLLVGVIWPALLFVMAKGGLVKKPARVPERKYHSEPEAAPVKATATAGDMQRLRDLEAALTASLKSGEAVATRAVAIGASVEEEKPVIKKLDGASEPLKPAPVVEEEKDFSGGVFYPVAKPHAPPKN
jgi:hypothetical protein